MFDINFIEEPGLQKEISDATWSYLHKKNELVENKQPKIKESSKSLTWKDYVFSLSILSFILDNVFLLIVAITIPLERCCFLAPLGQVACIRDASALIVHLSKKSKKIVQVHG